MLQIQDKQEAFVSGVKETSSFVLKKMTQI